MGGKVKRGGGAGSKNLGQNEGGQGEVMDLRGQGKGQSTLNGEK